jgi:hypothetical protein
LGAVGWSDGKNEPNSHSTALSAVRPEHAQSFQGGGAPDPQTRGLLYGGTPSQQPWESERGAF